MEELGVGGLGEAVGVVNQDVESRSKAFSAMIINCPFSAFGDGLVRRCGSASRLRPCKSFRENPTPLSRLSRPSSSSFQAIP